MLANPILPIASIVSEYKALSSSFGKKHTHFKIICPGKFIEIKGGYYSYFITHITF